jgi:hypothetical protein
MAYRERNRIKRKVVLEKNRRGPLQISGICKLQTDNKVDKDTRNKEER